MNTNKRRGTLAAVVLAAVALMATASAGAAARDDGRPVPTAVLKPVGGSGVYGSASFGPYQGGTVAALVVHGLKARGFARARLHAGTSLARLSASFTPLPDLWANRRGTARVNGRVLFRGIDDVAFEDIVDGEHSVVIVSRGRIVAYAVVPTE
jgi:hypothetical protein